MRRSVPIAIGALCLAGALLAQEPYLLAYVPPPNANGADRNDPGVQFGLGEEDLPGAPAFADERFRWAARLNPMWGLPLYGRAICQLSIWRLEQMRAYAVTGRVDEPTSSEVHLVDSLMLAAMLRDPFPDRRLDALLSGGRTESVRRTIHVGSKKVKLPKEYDEGELKFFRRDFKGALADWATVLREKPELSWIHQMRAEAFYKIAAYDSAIGELRVMVDTLAKREQSEVTYEFEGRAMAIYSIAQIQLQQDSNTLARRTFEEALTVDLGLYMAHVKMASIALEANDTAEAVVEMKHAAELNDADPSIAYQYGYALMLTGADDSAVVQLRKAIAIDPYFADPYNLLGRIFDARGKTEDAIAAYQGFIDHAWRGDPQLMWTVARVATLGAGSGAKP